ncbi:unnamed protein product [Discosporangium mesarthrocarpum]
MCHPGTLATFSDSQTYLKNRYPNRDLITEGQLQTHRRHSTPRSIEDYAPRTGVPDSVLNGDMTNWIPDWASSLETRFHNRVKAWLLGPCRAQDSDANPPGLAFVSPPSVAASTRAMRIANNIEAVRWSALSSLYSVSSSARSAVCAFSSGSARRRPSSALRMLLGLNQFGSRFRGRPAAPVNTMVVKVAAQADTGDDIPVPAATVDLDLKLKVPVAPLAQEQRPGLLSSILGGAMDAFDTTVSFVGCALVTSPLGNILNDPEGGKGFVVTVPASAIRSGVAMGADPYDLVGFSNIDPFEASRRHSSGRFSV